MNKKGFTLVELLVSIALLSIVLIFMMDMLIGLKNNDIIRPEETNLITGQYLITNTINKDILEHAGIKTISQTAQTGGNGPINITYNDGEQREIRLTSSNVLTFYDVTTSSDILLIRKAPDGYEYSLSLSQTQSNKLTKILVGILKNSNSLSNYNSEIFYYDRDN